MGKYRILDENLWGRKGLDTERHFLCPPSGMRNFGPSNVFSTSDEIL